MKKIKIFTLLVAASLATTSCKDFLEEKPLDFIGPAQVTEPNLIANGALNTLTSGSMFRYGQFPNLWDYDSDDATGPSWAFGDVGAGNYQAYWGLDAGWNGPYTLIHRSNFGISQINKMSADEAVKKNALGQLYFLRAWGYFLLVRAYGAVPLFTQSVAEGADPQQPRKPVKEVYEFIIDNLKQAEANLYSSHDAGYEPGRPSKGAASSLLAKVYLTMASGSLSSGQVTVMGGKAYKLVAGKKVLLAPQALTHTKTVVAGLEGLNSAEYFKLARDKAQEVINSGDYHLFPSHLEVWSVANRNRGEHIWSLQSLSNDPDFGNEISLFRVGRLDQSKNGEIEGGWIGTSYQWLHLFEEKDQRITDGVLHRWKMWGDNMHYFPLSDSLVVRGVDKSPEAEAKRAKYGYQPTDQSGLDDGRIARLRKFEAVSNRNITLGDFHFPLLRYADVLLMFAEADNEVNGGPTADAKEAVNQVRRRNSASEVGALSQQEFRSFVLEERRRELALEGDRHWDLKRWGIYLQVMNAIDIDENNVIKRRQQKHLLFPIPISEVSANKLLGGNNPGW